MSKIRMKVSALEDNVLVLQFLHVDERFANKRYVMGIGGKRWEFLIGHDVPHISITDDLVTIYCASPTMNAFHIAPSFKFGDSEDRQQFVDELRKLAEGFAEYMRKSDDETAASLDAVKSITIEA